LHPWNVTWTGTEAYSFHKWSIASLYRPDVILIVLRKLTKYKLDLVLVQDVSWYRVALN